MAKESKYFTKENMERPNLNRLKAMLNHYSLTLKDLANITGLDYGSVRCLTTKKKLPKWLMMALFIFEREHDGLNN